MSNAKISICMPAYEPKCEHIRAAVESILAQSFCDWTLLINDDASVREDVAAHVEPYLKDPRIRLRRNPKNLGIGGNWNACVREVEDKEADYFAFLFHDDVWKPAYLKRMIDALERNPSAGFVAANHTYLKEGDVHAAPFYDELHDFVSKNIQPGLHEHRSFLRWWLARGLRPNVVGEPSFVVLRRSLMKQVGPFNASMVQFLDSEYWARCLLHADWVYVPEILGEFRVHPQGMSAVNEKLGRGVFERLSTLETVLRGLPRTERKEASTAIVTTLSEMIGKYFTRRKEGKNVSGKGSRSIGTFALRHPVLFFSAAMRYLFHYRGWLARHFLSAPALWRHLCRRTKVANQLMSEHPLPYTLDRPSHISPRSPPNHSFSHSLSPGSQASDAIPRPTKALKSPPQPPPDHRAEPTNP